MTVLASLWRAPNELVNVGIAIAIATVKAAFVVRFFMHLKFEGKLIYTIFLAPLTLAVVLTIALIPDIALGTPRSMTWSGCSRRSSVEMENKEEIAAKKRKIRKKGN